MRKVFENNDFLIIDKPSGIDFHGEAGPLAALRAQGQEVFGVHRLDKDTSGLLLLAKSKLAQSELSQIFQKRLVTKIYFALSNKKPKKKMGKIKGDLEKGRGGSYYLKTSLENPSETDFISYYQEEKNLRLFILSPKTGKTHQLRVVMKSLGAPILGDKRYGGQEADRMYLHAHYLAFRYNNLNFQFESFPTQGLFAEVDNSFRGLLSSELSLKIIKKGS